MGFCVVGMLNGSKYRIHGEDAERLETVLRANGAQNPWFELSDGSMLRVAHISFLEMDPA